MIEEKLSRISKEKAKVETLLRDANKDFSNDDNVNKLFEQYKGFFKETVLLEEAKAPKAPQNVKPKPSTVKTKEAAEEPKPDENVKELAEKTKGPAEKAQEAPQNVKPKLAAVKTKEVAKKPKPAKNVVPTATVMKAEDREEFEVETFTQWIEGNIDWVGEDELHDWPRRIDVTARCKMIEFVLGNSLFAMKGDKYETVFQSLGGYRELSSIRVSMETLAPTLCIDANVLFPIYASDHFYVVVFNIKKPKTMVILDNSDCRYGYALKYKEACDPFEFGLCEESDEQLSMLQRMRYKIATKIMLHQFNVVLNKRFDFTFTFETKYTEQARVSMIVDAIKNRNNRDPPKQVKKTDAANVVVGVNEMVDQVKKKRRRKK
nr:hypothetical protein [Tanacetum cinerariifolium]